MTGAGEVDPAALAVTARATQWELDALAFHLPRGEVRPEHCRGIAEALADLAMAMRHYANETERMQRTALPGQLRLGAEDPRAT